MAASWRLILSVPLTLLLILALGGTPRIPRPRELAVMAVSGVALALHFGLWMMSLRHLAVGPSVTIVDSYPALLAVAGRILFGERYTRAQLLGAAMALSGVFLLSLYSSRHGLAPEGGDPALGAVLSFAGMLMVALYFIIGKSMRRTYGTLEYTLIVYSFAALASALITVALGYPLTGYTLRTYALLALLALLPMLGGHTIINYALGHTSLLAATVPILGEPFGASLLAWLILGETLDPPTLALMILTLSGIGLTLTRERR